MAPEVIYSRYEVLETISSRDDGALVFLKAHDKAEDRVVALCVLEDKRISSDRSLISEFRAAVQQAELLKHPNIVSVYQQEEDADTGDIVLSTEYVRGITLRERIRRIAPFSLTVAVDISVAICEALDGAHRSGVVHGALRPQDVLLSPEGQIKVDGFGYSVLAIQLAGTDHEPTAMAYLPPGVAVTDTPMASVDIYALGMILYEMLTGKVMTAAERIQPPSPRVLNPGIPPALEGIVQKALQPAPATRYHTAVSLLDDLQAVREALRSGRSLAWSPAVELRQPAEISAGVVGGATRQAPARTSTAKVTSLQTAERHSYDDPGPSRTLGITLKVLSVIVILGIIGLIAYLVKLTSSPPDITVPKLIGMSLDDAKQMGAQQHFNAVQAGAGYSTKWPANQIYSQDPSANSTIKYGKDIRVYVSLGPQYLTVPDLVGKMQDVAVQILKEANLPLGKVTEQYSPTVQKGKVLSQSLSAGQTIDRNTPVSFIISKGQQPPDIPVDVAAQPLGPDRILLTWKASERATYYKITRTLDSVPTVVAQKVLATRFVDSGLSPDTSYSYTVDAVNISGDSGESELAIAITASPGTPETPDTSPTNGETVPADPNAPLNTDGADVPPSDQSPATPPPVVTPNPSATPNSSPTVPATQRNFTIRFRVPRHPRGAHHVRFEVQDSNGDKDVYDDSRLAGEWIEEPITAFGNKIIFRIFLDDKLVKQQSL